MAALLHFDQRHKRHRAEMPALLAGALPQRAGPVCWMIYPAIIKSVGEEELQRVRRLCQTAPTRLLWLPPMDPNPKPLTGSLLPMIIVTGAAGFIGSNLLAGLEAAERGPLVACDWLGDAEKWRNIAKRDLWDVIPPETLLEYFRAHVGRIEAVFHMGANSATTERDGDRILRENIRPTLDLVEACAAAGVPLIYASSAATYGDGEAGFLDDEEPQALAKLRPLNLYGWSKHMIDRRIATMRRAAHRLPPQLVGLKFFNVYGPNELHKGDMMSVVSKLTPKLAAGEPARLFKSYRDDYPDGGQMRDFVHVDDVVKAMLWLLESPGVSGLFNLGSGKARTWDDLARAVFTALGKTPAIEYIDMPEGLRAKYQYWTEAPLTKLQAAGFGGNMLSLEDGVAQLVQDYLVTDDPYR